MRDGGGMLATVLRDKSGKDLAERQQVTNLLVRDQNAAERQTPRHFLMFLATETHHHAPLALKHPFALFPAPATLVCIEIVIYLIVQKMVHALDTISLVNLASLLENKESEVKIGEGFNVNKVIDARNLLSLI